MGFSKLITVHTFCSIVDTFLSVHGVPSVLSVVPTYGCVVDPLASPACCSLHSLKMARVKKQGLTLSSDANIFVGQLLGAGGRAQGPCLVLTDLPNCPQKGRVCSRPQQALAWGLV